MDNYFRTRRFVDEDIANIQKTLRAYSHDGEILEKLFLKVLQRHRKIITGFDEDLALVVPGESNTERAAACRYNLKRLYDRLTAFRDNGYENKEAVFIPGQEVVLAFSQARKALMECTCLPQRIIKEVEEKIDELEEICLAPKDGGEKWESFRPYLIWLSGKEAKVGFLFLPLFLTAVQQREGEGNV